MTLYLFADNAKGTLAAPISTNSIMLSLASGQGILFPAPGDGEAFLGTIGTAASNEIVTVTARTGDVFTIQRSSAPKNWPAGSTFALLLPTEALEAFPQWSQIGEGIPYKTVDLGAGGGTIALDLGDLPPKAPVVMIAVTAAAPIAISDITGATLGLTVILAVLAGSSPVSIPLNTAPFYLSNVYGSSGFPGFVLTAISLLFNPLNSVFKWVELGRTQRTS